MQTDKQNDMSENKGGGKEHLTIFVNRTKFDEGNGVTPSMTVAALAALVDVPAEVAVVRRTEGNSGKVSDPLTGIVTVKNGDQFVVTRSQVNGGCEAEERIDRELRLIEEGGQKAERVSGGGVKAVIYRDLPILGNPTMGMTDVLVPVPGGYPAAMLDHAALPEGSPLIGRVKGAAQNVFQCGGRTWRTISYHPHNGGGFGPWDPRKHGFHSYLTAILSWLGNLQ